MGNKQKLRRERKEAERQKRSASGRGSGSPSDPGASPRSAGLGPAGRACASIYPNPSVLSASFSGQYQSTLARAKDAPREGPLGPVAVATDIGLASQMLASEVIEHSARQANPPPACRAGCSWCCYYDVRVPEVEAIAISDALTTALPKDRLDELKRRIDEAVGAGVGQMTSDERATARIPCPLLNRSSGECEIYPFRPVSCRQALSEDAELCRKSLDGEPSLHSFGGEQLLGSAISLATQAALFDSHLPSGSIELATGLQRALAHEDAAKSWQAGQAVIDAQPTFNHDGSLGPAFAEVFETTRRVLQRARPLRP